MGNDPVIDWLRAFLESFRRHDPELPLYILAYDDRLEQTTALADRYGAKFFRHPWFDELERIASQFAGKVNESWWVPAFRRFAMFDGPLDHFLYCDCDIVTLESVEPIIRRFAESGADVGRFDGDAEEVYTGETLRRRMIAEYGAQRFTVGVYLGRRGCMSIDAVSGHCSEALSLIHEMYIGYDQSYFNFCVDTERLNVVPLGDLVPDLATGVWASTSRRFHQSADGTWRIGNPDDPDYGKRLMMMHWAGQKIGPEMAYAEVFHRYLYASMTPAERWAYRRQRAAESFTTWLGYKKAGLRRRLGLAGSGG